MLPSDVHPVLILRTSVFKLKQSEILVKQHYDAALKFGAKSCVSN